jgi:hypothetical protein
VSLCNGTPSRAEKSIHWLNFFYCHYRTNKGTALLKCGSGNKHRSSKPQETQHETPNQNRETYDGLVNI